MTSALSESWHNCISWYSFICMLLLRIIMYRIVHYKASIHDSSINTYGFVLIQGTLLIQ